MIFADRAAGFIGSNFTLLTLAQGPRAFTPRCAEYRLANAPLQRVGQNSFWII
jgi:hypothetical protein